MDLAVLVSSNINWVTILILLLIAASLTFALLAVKDSKKDRSEIWTNVEDLEKRIKQIEDTYVTDEQRQKLIKGISKLKEQITKQTSSKGDEKSAKEHM